MKTLEKLLKIAGLGFLGLMLLTLAVGFFMTKTTSPEEYASSKIESQKRSAIAKDEKAKAQVEKEILKAKKEFEDNLYSYELTARVCAQGYIESMLSPKPAKFPLKEATYDKERDLFRIFSYVDTVNNFNAPIRQNYYCEISGIDLETSLCAKTECVWQ